MFLFGFRSEGTSAENRICQFSPPREADGKAVAAYGAAARQYAAFNCGVGPILRLRRRS
jgi:hypothetical protein